VASTTGTKSGYRGVTPNKGKWQAKILRRVGGKKVAKSLGSFVLVENAAHACARAAMKEHSVA